jgi:ribose 1,5-bisphosphokinase
MSKLFYIIGASGAGKDSLMNHCREQINGAAPVVFAHRYITRPVGAGAENHIALSRAEFEMRLHKGLFAMHWESHGLMYGIGIEINDWLKNGLTVIINGSREYLKNGLEKYPAMQPVLIDADSALIETRLYSRAREDDEAILKRLARNQQLHLNGEELIRIQNNNAIDDAAQQLLKVILPAKNFADIDH